jgi:uncharacterized membrane protein
MPRVPAAVRPFRRAVLRGLAVLCPPLLTVLIVVWAIDTTKNYLLEPVISLARDGLVWGLADVRTPEELSLPDRGAKTAELGGRAYHQIADGTFVPQTVYDKVRRQPGEPPPVTGEAFYRRYVDLTYLRPHIAIPFFLAVFVLLLYFLGKSMAAGLGLFVAGNLERLVLRLPGVRAVYSAVKQVSDFFFSEREIKFTRIVAVEHPRKGVWSVGFVTGEGIAAIDEKVDEPMVTVLVPYSPLPVTGCTIVVRKSECIELNMTFDQACQFIVSCGVVSPAGQLTHEEEGKGAKGERQGKSGEGKGKGRSSNDERPGKGRMTNDE